MWGGRRQRAAEAPQTRWPCWFEALGVVVLSYVGVVAAILGALLAISGLSVGEIVRLLAGGT